MLKARVQKVERNSHDPQVDVTVVYTDEEKKFQTERVFTFPVDAELTIGKVQKAIDASGQELKSGLADTILKENAIRDEFQGKEIDI